MTIRTSLLLLGSVVLGAQPASATTWTVLPDGTGDFPSIQAAVSLCAVGDTVEVACGTYYEHDIIMKDGVRLVSASQDPSCVTVDAQGLGRVFYFSGIDEYASLCGFTITGGRAGSGGGILCKSASYPTIENCIITGNEATEGAGIFCFHGSPTLIDCVIRDNNAYAWGGGISCYDNSLPTVTNCEISANTAGDYGGGAWIHFYSSPQFTDCTFAGNSAGIAGGAMHGVSSNIWMTDCVVTGNAADDRGGAFRFTDSYPVLTGCTVAGNRATNDAGGAFYCESSPLTLTSSIVWGNGAPAGASLYLGDSAPFTISCSNVDTTSAGWSGGAGTANWSGSNGAADPLFCGAEDFAAAPTEAGVYDLNPASPALPGASPCTTLIGALGEGSCLASTGVPFAAAGPVAARSYPNPFRMQTTIEFELPDAAPVRLAVYDTAGRRVRTLVAGTVHAAGRVAVPWDGRDEAGRPVAAGVYFTRLIAGTATGTHRLVHLQ
ncbi:right-handed parallel beta-helix repeat-containing protein [bacterium]|nr:right-handed parallel beta-helix repeat-containing protein [bacterium]